MLLTRAPLYSWYCYHFLVRLACVRHAASVDSEPGSNSRLKPDVFPLRRRSDWVDRPAHLLAKDAGTLPCENDQAKPDRISRLACSTNLSKILEGGPPKRYPFGSRPGLYVQVSSNLLRIAFFLRYLSGHRRFCANLLKLSKFRSPGQGKNSPEPLWITRSHCAKYQRATSKTCPSR